MTPDQFSDLSGLDVSRETFDRLSTYVQLLRKWNPAINLVSKTTLDDAWARHIVDSSQVFFAAPQFDKWADIGTGGGFPGLVVGILSYAQNPDSEITLIEADRRKSSFLRNVSRETDLNVKIVTERIEMAPEENVDVLSARALAPLDKLLEFTMRHRKPDGVSLFPKGIRFQEELDAAKKKWNFDYEVIQSRVDSNSVILKIGKVTHV